MRRGLMGLGIIGLFGCTETINPVILETTSLPPAAINTGYDQRFKVTGGRPPYRFDIVGGHLPSDLHLKASTGQVFGTLTEAGTFRFAVQVVDRDEQSDLQTIALHVSANALRIVDEPLPAAVTNTPYRARIRTLGGLAPIRIGLTQGELPDGLTLASNGKLTGTTDRPGGYSFTVTARDARAQIAFHETTLEVLAEDRLRILTTSVAAGRVDRDYEAEIMAAGGQPPYQFVVEGGQLPDNMSLTHAGSLVGTPFIPGRYPFTVRVNDAERRHVRTSLMLEIVPGLRITSERLIVLQTNVPFDLPLIADGGVPPYQWQLRSPAVPGITLDPSGRLSGVLANGEDHRLLVRVQDAFESDTDDILLSARDPPLYVAQTTPMPFPPYCDTSTHVSYQSVPIEVTDSFQVEAVEVFVDIRFEDNRPSLRQTKIMLTAPDGRPGVLCGHAAGLTGPIFYCKASFREIRSVFGPGTSQTSFDTFVGLHSAGTWRLKVATVRPRPDFFGCRPRGVVHKVVLKLHPDPSPEPYIQVRGFTVNNLLFVPWARISGGGLAHNELFLSATLWDAGANGRREGTRGDDRPQPNVLTWHGHHLPPGTTISPDGHVQTGTVTSQGLASTVTASDGTETASITLPLLVMPPDWVPRSRAF